MDRKRVSELAKQVRGVSYKPEDLHDRLDDNSVILLRANNICDGKISFDDVVYVDKSKVSKEQYLRKGDVLICASSGSKQLVGKAASVDFDIECTFGAFCKTVRPNSNIADYLGVYFQSNDYRQRISEAAIGANINNIRNEHIDSLVLLVGTDTENADVVRIMTSIQRVIDGRKQELQKLDDLVKARFVELFGNPDLAEAKPDWVAIVDIGKVVGGSTPKTGVAEYWDGEYRWLSPAELDQDSGVIYDSVRKISKAGVESCALQELPVGTVILSSRAPIGKVAIAGNTFYCNQGFKNIICNERILPRYLYSLLLFNTGYLNSLGRGATFKEISKSIVESIKIPVPSLESQNEFAHFCEQLDKSKFAKPIYVIFCFDKSK